MMRIGFTGTRHGATTAQLTTLTAELATLRRAGAHQFHHGVCIGSDVEAATIARSLGYSIHNHPSTFQRTRGKFEGDVLYQSADPLIRNEEIIHYSQHMLATPRTHEEERRSGTWHAIRYTRRCNKPLTIIWPDGTTQQEPPQ